MFLDDFAIIALDSKFITLFYQDFMASTQPFPIPPQVPKKRTSSPTKKRSSTASNFKSKRDNSHQEHQLELYPMKNKNRPRRNVGNNQGNQRESAQNIAKIEQFPSPKQPLWLQGLMSLHFISSCTTFVLISAALGLYGWTVYTQQSWGKSYHYLETLQRNERQLTTTNETIKNDLAIQAENPEMGLVNPDPNTTIFLKPTPDELKSPDLLPSEENNLGEINTPTNVPLGY